MDAWNFNCIHGENCIFQPGTVLGLQYKQDCNPAKIGSNCIVRTGSIIYADVEAGDHLQTGHNTMIREKTTIGNHVVIGTNTVIDGTCAIGEFVKIESNCYIPTHVNIGNRVFIGPGTTFTNDKYPLKMRDSYTPLGPVLEDDVTIGGGVVIVPGVRIGKGSFIAAGAVVTKDVPPHSLVRGVPGEIFPLPDKLNEPNMALSWRKYLG